MLQILYLFLFGALGDFGNQATWEFRLPTNNQAFARRNLATGKVSELNNTIFQKDDAVTFGFESQPGPHCELVEDYVLCFVFQGLWKMHKYDIYENNWKFIQNFEQVDAVRYFNGFLFVITGNHFKKCDVLSWKCTSVKIADIPENNDWVLFCPPVHSYHGISNEFSWIFYRTDESQRNNGFLQFDLKVNSIKDEGYKSHQSWWQYKDCSKRIWKGSRLLQDFPIAKHYQDYELQKVIDRFQTSMDTMMKQREQDITKISKWLQDSNLLLTKQSIEISELQQFVFIWNFVGLVVVCVFLWFVVVGLIRHFYFKAVIDG
jgi:hypothetical protein